MMRKEMRRSHCCPFVKEWSEISTDSGGKQAAKSQLEIPINAVLGRGEGGSMDRWMVPIFLLPFLYSVVFVECVCRWNKRVVLSFFPLKKPILGFYFGEVGCLVGGWRNQWFCLCQLIRPIFLFEEKK